jgi:hypothetical protein
MRFSRGPAYALPDRRQEENAVNEYFTPPEMCQSKSGGLYDYICEYHAKRTGGKSVCLFRKSWSSIFPGFECPNKGWKNARIPLPQRN